jgi:competence protein ComEC
MATALPTHAPTPPAENVWEAPLLAAALAVTAGVVLDRHGEIPLFFSLPLGAVALAAFAITRVGAPSGLPLVFLTLAGVAFGAAYHHDRRLVYPGDDIGYLADDTPRPVRLRGWLDEEPRRQPEPDKNPLRTMQPDRTSAAVLWVTQLHRDGDWVTLSGRVRLQLRGALPELHTGDEVEAVGQLSAIGEPANPGEFDFGDYWLDQRVRARLVVREVGGITLLARGWYSTPRAWPGVIRQYGHEALQKHLPESVHGVAGALLLGEGAPMTNADWQKYVRTGVVHVLAISGQHLVVLGWFLWLGLGVLGVRQRPAILLVAAVLLGYAVLTGGRPPAMRAAVGACYLAFGVVLRRPIQPANLLGLAWLAVLLLNPGDVFDSGCQLSFVAVAILHYLCGRILARDRDPLEDLVDAARPAWQRGLRWFGLQVWESYAICLIVWLFITPLVAYRTHLAAPAGLVLGPPLTLLASVALLFGFGMLLFPPLAFVFSYPVRWSLWLCEYLVDLAEAWPVHVYLPTIPEILIWIFYIIFFAFLMQRFLRPRWRWGVVVGLGWLCMTLTAGAAWPPRGELRCTFLAVGHGGCAVIEAPDGRTLLYDAGAMNGPEVTQRQIVPFLWARGVRRLDEVFLSHADLDHYNGLAGLLDYIAVGQVTTTPTFEEKSIEPVRLTLEKLARHRVPFRTVAAGDRLMAGETALEVLHPPRDFRGGSENARSTRLRVRHAGHTILLTGDLEGEGLARVLALAREPTDVLQAPHHGSHRLDVPALADWAGAKLVVSCQGRPRGQARAPAIYRKSGAVFWSTHEVGAVTVRAAQAGLSAESFRPFQRLALRGAGP